MMADKRTVHVRLNSIKLPVYYERERGGKRERGRRREEQRNQSVCVYIALVLSVVHVYWSVFAEVTDAVAAQRRLHCVHLAFQIYCLHDTD